MISLKNFFKAIVPPILNFRTHRLGKSATQQDIWSGDFKTWAEAEALCNGYDSSIILEKCKDSLLKVKNGEAVYERDSVLFDKIQYSFPLLAGLMWIAAQNDGRLKIIDFGGSLGSTYLQNSIFFNNLKEVKWDIVEQPNFVKVGKEYFEDKNLKFFYSIDECLKFEKSDAIILSGVLQYIETPYELIKRIIAKEFNFVIFDRTIFNNVNEDRLAIQKVDPAIYEASYPCWFLNKQKLQDLFSDKYILITEFPGFCDGTGLIFKKK
jgi:putative methyltransferase (TIGR04325 family)